jgi:hypothetical protein
MAGKRLPIWEPSRPRSKGHFDFDTNSWVSENPVAPMSGPSAKPWQMPEVAPWIESSAMAPSFEERLWNRPWLLGLYLLVLGAVAVCRFILLIDPFSLCAFVLCVGLPFLAIVTIYAIDPNSNSFARAHKTIEDALDLDVCPVVLTIFQSGLVTGEDAGVAWFEGPSLFFNGSLCSFAIGHRDVSREAIWKLAAKTVGHFTYDDFVFLRGAGPIIGLRLAPAFYAGEPNELPEPGRRFLARVREFKPGEGGPDRSSYPPLSISPSLRKDPLPFRYLLLLQISAFIYFAVLGMLAGAPMGIGVVVAGLCALAIPALRPRRNPKIIALVKGEKVRGTP